MRIVHAILYFHCLTVKSYVHSATLNGKKSFIFSPEFTLFFRKKIFSTRNISSEDQQKLAYASFPTCIEFSQNWEIQPLQPFLSNYVGLKFYSFYYEINVDFFHNCVSFWDVFGLPIEIGRRNNTHINCRFYSAGALTRCYRKRTYVFNGLFSQWK